MPHDPPYRRLFRLPLGGSRRAEQEMDEEIDTHLHLCAEELIRQGVPPHEAMQRAIARFGNLGSAREKLRAGAREREVTRQQRDWWGSVLADIRFAAVQMRRFPGFTALAILTLALGIGLTTATFSLVNGVLLQPLPLDRPEQLVALLSRDSTGRDIDVVSAGNLEDWRAGSNSLAGAALHMSRGMDVGLEDGVVRVPGQIVSGAFFEVLRPSLLLGRAFTSEEVRQQLPVVVISEGLWHQFGADSGLGRAIRINGVDHTVLGVVRAGGEYPAGTALWGGVSPQPETGAMRNNIGWSAVGRLRAGVSLEQARPELQRVALDVHQRIPEALYTYGVGVVPLRQYVVGDATRMLVLLMLAVSAVLLIACANLATANLGRGASRGREFAVRTALGAGRGRLVQQVLIEQLCLAVAGGLLGTWLAWVGVRLVLATWGAEIPRAVDVSFSLPVLGFAMLVSIATGIAAGLLPALRSSRVNPAGLMSSGQRTAQGGRGLPGARLIMGEIALALILLTGAGLLLRSFQRLLQHDLGFGVEVVTAEAGLPRTQFPSPERAVAFWRTTISELAALPGVAAIGVANWAPLGSAGSSFIEIAGKSGANQGADYRAVGGAYFAALDIPLLRGRVLDEQDDAGAPRVVVINQLMAEKYWPGEDPIGHQVRAPSMEPPSSGVPTAWLTVIGIVGNVRHWGMEVEAPPQMYVDFRQVPNWAFGMTALVKGSAASEELPRTVQRTMRSIDPRVAVVMGTLSQRLDASLANRRFMMTVLTGFSVLALTLAGIGLYAVLAYSVTRRTRELAVRTALGASRAQLLKLIFEGAAQVVLVGVILGVGGALMLSRSMASFLVDIVPFDLVSFSLAAFALILVAAIATLIPALRATRPDPLLALQQE